MSPTEEKSLVLNAAQVKQKIRRMASAIVEQNYGEKQLIVAGIAGQGYKLAGLLAKEIGSCSPIKVDIVQVNMDKQAPQQGEISLDCDLKAIRKKCIVLVDDVLNTGRTLAFGLKPFLNTEVKKIEIAVLVNRDHGLYPVYPQYTGYELATTLEDHVEVKLGQETAVFLL